jgi:hypothetical protein
MSKLLARPYEYNGSGYSLQLRALSKASTSATSAALNSSHLDNVGPKGSSDCLCSVPITAGFGSVQHYSMGSSISSTSPALTTQQLSFELRDRDYNILTLLPNISFTLTID